MSVILLIGSITLMIFAVKKIMNISDQKNCFSHIERLQINGKATNLTFNDNKLYIISELPNNQYLTIIDPCNKSKSHQIMIENLVE